MCLKGECIMRNLVAAVALTTALSSGTADAQRYFARSKLTIQNAERSVDQYEIVDVIGFSRSPPDYRETTAQAYVRMSCTNPKGNVCGGGGPLVTSKTITIPAKYTYVGGGTTGDGRQFEVWWAAVTPPSIKGGGMASICRSYAFDIGNTLSGRPVVVNVREGDGTPSDNNCMTPAFS